MTNFFPNRLVADDPLLDRLRSSTLGLYDVAGEIGRGGMAVVYIATDMRLGRKVAIKVMEPRLNFTPGMAERFLQEAQIAAQLQHHNIIVVHEVRQDEELIFFVMRLVEGGSLDEVCRRLTQKQRQLPIDQAQWILWQSARALAYAHSEGFVHRDVKPANILISTKGEVVVTDFGIARA
ncbi:MAG: serine/threonine-protein kinase, partial [Gemmatimonas sp.]